MHLNVKNKIHLLISDKKKRSEMVRVDERNSRAWAETLDPVIEKDRKRGNTAFLTRNSFRMFLLSGYWLSLWKTGCSQGNLLDY